MKIYAFNFGMKVDLALKCVTKGGMTPCVCLWPPIPTFPKQHDAASFCESKNKEC